VSDHLVKHEKKEDGLGRLKLLFPQRLELDHVIFVHYFVVMYLMNFNAECITCEEN